MTFRNPLPYSPYNDPKEYKDLTERQQDILRVWIEDCISPYETKGYYPHHNSYGLKHRFELSEHGFYLSNGAFKGGMIEFGFEPKEKYRLNWTFKLGKKAAVNNELTIPII